MELPKNFEFFERLIPNEIENMIRSEDHEVCQNIYGADYIKNCLKQYDFGFVKISRQARPSRLQPQQNIPHVHGFILCKLIPNPLFRNIDITLVCSLTNPKDGKQLLELAEQRAKLIGYQCLSLILIGNLRQLSLYKSRGYVVESEKTIINSENSAYYLRKFIVEAP
jgi:hypothetical protein